MKLLFLLLNIIALSSCRSYCKSPDYIELGMSRSEVISKMKNIDPAHYVAYELIKGVLEKLQPSHIDYENIKEELENLLNPSEQTWELKGYKSGDYSNLRIEVSYKNDRVDRIRYYYEGMSMILEIEKIKKISFDKINEEFDVEYITTKLKT